MVTFLSFNPSTELYLVRKLWFLDPQSLFVLYLNLLQCSNLKKNSNGLVFSSSSVRFASASVILRRDAAILCWLLALCTLVAAVSKAEPSHPHSPCHEHRGFQSLLRPLDRASLSSFRDTKDLAHPLSHLLASLGPESPGTLTGTNVNLPPGHSQSSDSLAPSSPLTLSSFASGVEQGD